MITRACVILAALALVATLLGFKGQSDIPDWERAAHSIPVPVIIGGELVIQ